MSAASVVNFSPSIAPLVPHAGEAAAPWAAAGVWRAAELASSAERTLDTGYPALNAALPGGGWPVGALTELLQRRPGLGEWGLLAPALAGLVGASARGQQNLKNQRGKQAPAFRQNSHPLDALTGNTVLVGSPHSPLGPALAARSGAPGSWLRVQASTAAERLWSAEQALRCAEVAAVLLWLPHAPAAHLRRLHLAAQTYCKLLFVFRAEDAWQHSSPAPLRLHLAWAAPQADGAPPALLVQVLKRRGPPLAQPLMLQTSTPALQALLVASRAQSRSRRAGADSVRRPEPQHDELPGSLAPSLMGRKEPGHVVDRLAAWS